MRYTLSFYDISNIAGNLTEISSFKWDNIFPDITAAPALRMVSSNSRFIGK